jgi:hypothetical protein
MAKIRDDESCPCGSGKLFGECHGPRVIREVPPEIKTRTRLKVIPEPDPDTRSVFELLSKEAGFQGFDSTEALVCGKCGAVLVSGVARENISNIVMKCYCGVFNEIS